MQIFKNFSFLSLIEKIGLLVTAVFAVSTFLGGLYQYVVLYRINRTFVQFFSISQSITDFFPFISGLLSIIFLILIVFVMIFIIAPSLKPNTENIQSWVISNVLVIGLLVTTILNLLLVEAPTILVRVSIISLLLFILAISFIMFIKSEIKEKIEGGVVKLFALLITYSIVVMLIIILMTVNNRFGFLDKLKKNYFDYESIGKITNICKKTVPNVEFCKLEYYNDRILIVYADGQYKIFNYDILFDKDDTNINK